MWSVITQQHPQGAHSDLERRVRWQGVKRLSLLKGIAVHRGSMRQATRATTKRSAMTMWGGGLMVLWCDKAASYRDCWPKGMETLSSRLSSSSGSCVSARRRPERRVDMRRGSPQVWHCVSLHEVHRGSYNVHGSVCWLGKQQRDHNKQMSGVRAHHANT